MKKLFLFLLLTLTGILISSYLMFSSYIKHLIHLDQAFCFIDGSAVFYFSKPSGEDYEISIKKDGISLNRSEVRIFYPNATHVEIIAPCTKVGKNKKCNFEISLNKKSFLIEIPCKFEEYFCNETKRSLCIFNGSLILSNLDALLWVRKNIPSNSIVIALPKYEDELKNIAKVNPLSNDLSFLELLEKKNRTEAFEVENKIKDVNIFFFTTNESEAVCIAKKYNARYVYLYKDDLDSVIWTPRIMWMYKFRVILSGYSYIMFPLYEISSKEKSSSEMLEINVKIKLINDKWLTYLLDRSLMIEGWLKTIYVENEKVKISEPQENAINISKVAILSKDFKKVYIGSENFSKSIITKLLLLYGYNLKHFKKLYSNDDVVIYYIDFDSVSC
jgi:hypothetical protein